MAGTIGVRGVWRSFVAGPRLIAPVRAVPRRVAVFRGVADLASGLAPVALGLYPVLPNLVSLVTAPGGVA